MCQILKPEIHGAEAFVANEQKAMSGLNVASRTFKLQELEEHGTVLSAASGSGGGSLLL
ncbi:hypothetical protein M427DRAFT_31256 [Gonapodya prolifera JEL478]|uniref:Uncharacterized protein n=1 Tax=Gonapodya prolifera (strain JEL478) TaxID=1344416 RepID=A0A139AIE3_GONPJ|nr:hypothetical protein M427DRAFT_31256 [Gonapodya prolifera JEL478]|eukprot:KXS16557.1 hypothetical protein M427DRAFT_31256 [Gonapodya prolifera JEL478]